MPADAAVPVMPRGTPDRKKNRYSPRKHHSGTLTRGDANNSSERNIIELKAFLFPVDAMESEEDLGRASSANGLYTYPHYTVSNGEQTPMYEPRRHFSCRTLDSRLPRSDVRRCDCV